MIHKLFHPKPLLSRKFKATFASKKRNGLSKDSSKESMILEKPTNEGKIKSKL
jgi:hypothetical protein